MFERGKKDDDTNQGMEFGAATRTPSREGTRPAASSGRGGAVIGRSIQISGDLRGNEDLRIEGDVSGTVELKNSHLVIGKEGKVRADVYAKSIAVDGTIEGDLYAAERVTIHVNAQVRGNITSPRVGIEEGARFKGSIEMDQEAVEKALGKADMKSVVKPIDEGKSANGASVKAEPKKAAGEAGSNAPSA